MKQAFQIKEYGWTGIGFDFAKDEAFRVWSSQWYQCTILVTECAIDVDLFCIDTERTMDANAFPLGWLEANEPKGPEPAGAELVERDT